MENRETYMYVVVCYFEVEDTNNETNYELLTHVALVQQIFISYLYVWDFKRFHNVLAHLIEISIEYYDIHVIHSKWINSDRNERFGK